MDDEWKAKRAATKIDYDLILFYGMLLHTEHNHRREVRWKKKTQKIYEVFFLVSLQTFITNVIRDSGVFLLRRQQVSIFFVMRF